jgi:hypothetical protein
MTANPSLLPIAARVFTEDEEDLFAELADDADLEALVEALFPSDSA